MSRRVPPSAAALKTRAESQPLRHVLHGADLNAAADERDQAALGRPGRGSARRPMHQFMGMPELATPLVRI